ncbi:MAG TPA: QsdR family transcriptional regulator [Candidatus Eisenbacteria bacterium]|nr:QsdR family transcriptional regulator [Candidatus Eisenbacteria bacterium]
MSPVVGPDSEERVIRAAARLFLHTGTVDMRAVARQLGIGRATLYRRRGSREALLTHVLLWLGLRNLGRAEMDVPTRPGPRRLLDVHALHIARMTNSPGLRTFVRAEPEAASRLLLDANGTVHLGMTRALADLIQRQELASGWRAPLGPDRLANIMSRIDETFMYADLIANDLPNIEPPLVVFEMLVGLHRPD